MSVRTKVIPTTAAVREEFRRQFAQAAVVLAHGPEKILDDLFVHTLRHAARSATRGMNASDARALLAREAARLEVLEQEHDHSGPYNPDLELLFDIHEVLPSGSAAFVVDEAADILMWLSYLECLEEVKRLRARALSAHGRRSSALSTTPTTPIISFFNLPRTRVQRAL